MSPAKYRSDSIQAPRSQDYEWPNHITGIAVRSIDASRLRKYQQQVKCTAHRNSALGWGHP
jgi:hypothetical protein